MRKQILTILILEAVIMLAIFILGGMYIYELFSEYPKFSKFLANATISILGGAIVSFFMVLSQYWGAREDLFLQLYQELSENYKQLFLGQKIVKELLGNESLTTAEKEKCLLEVDKCLLNLSDMFIVFSYYSLRNKKQKRIVIDDVECYRKELRELKKEVGSAMKHRRKNTKRSKFDENKLYVSLYENFNSYVTRTNVILESLNRVYKYPTKLAKYTIWSDYKQELEEDVDTFVENKIR